MNILLYPTNPCLVSTIIIVLRSYANLLNSFDEMHNNITIYFNNTEYLILLLFSRLILSFDWNNKKYYY